MRFLFSEETGYLSGFWFVLIVAAFPLSPNFPEGPGITSRRDFLERNSRC
jgi:hypothetical protein